MTKDIDWQPRIIDRLTELYGRKLSYKYIGELMTKEFQQTFSRSCISGKIHRLMLEKRGPQPVVHKVRVREHKQPPVMPQDPEPLRHICHDKPTFLELEYGDCKWPSGTSIPYTFCGVPAAPGEPYCSQHKEIAYNKPRKTWE